MLDVNGCMPLIFGPQSALGSACWTAKFKGEWMMNGLIVMQS